MNCIGTSIGTSYVRTNNANDTKEQIPANQVVEIALDRLKAQTTMHLRFGEMSCKLYFSEREYTYAVDFGFIDAIISTAKKEGISIIRNDEYGYGNLIGDDYGLTGVNLIKN